MLKLAHLLQNAKDLKKGKTNENSFFKKQQTNIFLTQE